MCNLVFTTGSNYKWIQQGSSQLDFICMKIRRHLTFTVAISNRSKKDEINFIDTLALIYNRNILFNLIFITDRRDRVVLEGSLVNDIVDLVHHITFSCGINGWEYLFFLLDQSAISLLSLFACQAVWCGLRCRTTDLVDFLVFIRTFTIGAITISTASDIVH